MAVTGKVYTNAIKGFCMGTYSWKASGGSTIKCMLVKNTHTPNQDTHDFIDDVSDDECAASGSYSAGGLAVTPIDPAVDTATNITKFDCVDLQVTTFTGTVRYLVFYYASGTAGTSNLICYADLGEDVTITNGTYDIVIDSAGLFKITVS